MMKLLSNPLSPYGRKVKMAMAMKGLEDKIELVPTDTTSRPIPRSRSSIRWGKSRCWW